VIDFSNLRNNITILDFFAGSGTTLHATMALNAEDGGNRQCILVTNNENNICEEVTYERNKRVIEGYTNAKGVAVDGLDNNNLRYYKSEFVPSNKSEANKRKLTALSTDLLCIKEDCYSPIETENGGFNEKDCKLFTNNKGKFMVVVYHSRNLALVCEQLTNYIKELETSEKVCLYVFSTEKETLIEEFQDIEDKIIAVPLPEAIYNAYRATFKTLKLDKKPLVIPTPEDEPMGETNLFTNEEEV
jgi:adenine-specific DNA-methyltransferase